MKELRMRISRSARYFVQGEVGDHTRAMWIVCHGYGQLGSDFIRGFEGLDNGTTAVVAPEGLSRFYLDGFYGKVGASWMTKEDRKAEIADQKNYLDALYRVITHMLPDEAVINLLGFSQGTATACRWLAETRYRIDNLILWAGDIPRDLPHYDRLKQTNCHYVYGHADPFIENKRVEEFKSWTAAQGLQFDVRTFDGKHQLDKETLQSLQLALTHSTT